MKTQPLGPFLGVSNRLQDFDLHVSRTGDYLSSALNVDIDNKGTIHRRRATKLIQALAGAHSLFMTGDTTGYIAQGTVLYPLTITGTTVSLGGMLKLLAVSTPISWCAVGDDLYYSNGTDSGRITAGVWYPIGLPSPAAPSLALVGGTLLTGHYQVSVSYRNGSSATLGEEGAISSSSNIEITGATGGIRVTLPAATPGATHAAVHLSACNGEVPVLAATVALGTGTYDLTTLATGHEAQQRYEDVLPAGALFYSNGRLCSFSGSIVYVGMPHRPGYYLPHEGYIPLPSAVTLGVENQGGTYLCTASETYWVPGDLGDGQSALANPVPFGAVPGTAFKHPKEPRVGWFSDKGIVTADTGGNVEALTADAFNVMAPASGNAAVFDEADGWRRVVSCGYCVNLETKALTTYSGWDFTSVSGAYGTKADGVYLLNCDGLVDASIGLGKQDFGTEALKHLPAVYLGTNCAEPMQLRVQAPNDVDYTYDARNSGADMQVQRIDPGKGLRANWYELTVMNQDGADFTLASVSFAPVASTRRI